MRAFFFICLTSSILFSCQNTPQEKQTKKDMTDTETETQILAQADLQKIVVPILKERGMTYEKYKKILARRANEGEQIGTRTADGLETTNTAKAGDFVVKNQTEAGEEYILSEEKFTQRYREVGEAGGDFSEYESTGKVVALEMTGEELERLELPAEFKFIAPWEEEMVCKKDDFLVSPPDFSEVYRIARKEFFETYQLEK